MKDDKIKNYIIIGVLAVFAIILMFVLNNKNKDNDSQTESKYKLVNNINTFFTIESTINKYITYLYQNKEDNLLIVLDSNYVLENELNKDNVIEKLGKLNGIHTFKAKKMFEEKIDNNNIRYYVYGLLQKDIINEFDYGTSYYIIVNVKKSDYTYSIIPYDGALFRSD